METDSQAKGHEDLELVLIAIWVKGSGLGLFGGLSLGFGVSLLVVCTDWEQNATEMLTTVWV